MKPLAFLVLLAVAQVVIGVYACNLEDRGTEPAAPRTSAPADTCKPPACYPDIRPPAPPK